MIPELSDDIKALINSQPKAVFITPHRKPDGDAFGSTLALRRYLLKKGHSVTLVSPTDFTDHYDWLPDIEHMRPYSGDNRADILKALNEADLIFCLDFNNADRTDDLAEPLRDAKGVKIMVDHHLEPEGFDDHRFWNSEAAATAELVGQLIEANGDKALIDQETAMQLFTGIVTDTGGFRFDSVTPDLHRLVADLMETGFDHTAVYTRVFDNFHEKRLRFYGYCLKDKLEVLNQYNTAIISVTQQELNDYDIRTGDTEGLVNFGLAISSVQLAILVIDRGELRKMSFRAKGNFPANKLASEHFNGGGHFSAAGGSSRLPLDETVRKIKDCLPDYRDLLTSPSA